VRGAGRLRGDGWRGNDRPGSVRGLIIGAMSQTPSDSREPVTSASAPPATTTLPPTRRRFDFTDLPGVRVGATATPGGEVPEGPVEPLRLRIAAGAAVENALRALLDRQNPDGHWRGELEGDSILESEYLLMQWIVGEEASDPRVPGLVRHLRSLQDPDHGGWSLYPGGPPDVSGTVKAWLCLRLAGDPEDAPHMRAAERAVREHGGAERANSFSKFYLAGLGLISWDAVPAIPPEMLHLPRWCPFHLDHMSAWTRTMVMPLAICTAVRPVRRLDASIRLDPLYLEPGRKHRLEPGPGAPLLRWNNAFLALDRVLKAAQRAGVIPRRRRAIERAAAWIEQRSDPARTEGLGAIFPPMVYAIIAFRALGHGEDHPVIRHNRTELEKFVIENEQTGTIRLEPCLSPVWDTGIALYTVTEAGHSLGRDTADHAVARASAWLRQRQVDFRGDWYRSAPVESGGWAFEYRNDWYPDVDDTAMVAMALHRAGGEENRAAARRGIAWLLALQNDDGGWAAFDRTRDRPILEAVPFADHNAIQDPSCPDITGRILESLAWHGSTLEDEPVQRAVAFIRSRQEPEGCWFGRWGVNYIYGTWQAVCGLRRIGQDMSAEWVVRAGRWLESIQQADGGFGESVATYDDPALKGQGTPTASQTAWAAIALHEIFGPEHPGLARAIAWLCRTQLSRDVEIEGVRDPAGSWFEREFTGTGFPRVFYLRYHLYRHYFPLLAVARWLDGQPDD